MTKLVKISLALPALLLVLSTMASARDWRVGDLPAGRYRS